MGLSSEVPQNYKKLSFHLKRIVGVHIHSNNQQSENFQVSMGGKVVCESKSIVWSGRRSWKHSLGMEAMKDNVVVLPT